MEFTLLTEMLLFPVHGLSSVKLLRKFHHHFSHFKNIFSLNYKENKNRITLLEDVSGRYWQCYAGFRHIIIWMPKINSAIKAKTGFTNDLFFFCFQNEKIALDLLIIQRVSKKYN